RQVIEYQLKEELYNWRPDVRPNVLGKFDEPAEGSGGEWSQPNPSSNWLLRAQADLTPAIIAKAIAKRLKKLGVDADTAARMDARVAIIEAKERSLESMSVKGSTTASSAVGDRTPWFCSGCPHNTSTKVPEGSRAVAGIGCHYMAVWMDRSTVTFSQMGGEGVSWMGQAPLTTDRHIFANLGDRTYFHSALLQVREIEGTTVIVYGETCAAEKRRRRKRGTMVEPAKRVIINELVCEGCGDCSVASNCLSVEPVETEFGRKRRINQNSCNKDYSCVNGFCPSFITVEGGQLKSKKADKARPNPFALPALPDPVLPVAETAWGIVVAGVGGTGVI